MAARPLVGEPGAKPVKLPDGPPRGSLDRSSADR
jgi:hypothetical protein